MPTVPTGSVEAVQSPGPARTQVESVCVGMFVLGWTRSIHLRSVRLTTGPLTLTFCCAKLMAKSLYTLSYSSARPMAEWPNSCEAISGLSGWAETVNSLPPPAPAHVWSLTRTMMTSMEPTP